MRARYTAYARGDEPFVLQTWHPDTRPAALRLDPAQTWIDLEILHCERGGVLDQEGVVAFAATFAEGGRTGLLEEVSRFVKVDRRWVYLDALDARLD